MNCERIQELILTDYLDDQLNPDQKNHIDQHLAQCPVCLDFTAAARKTVVEPFLHSKELEPSSSVWSGIKESILAQEERTNVFVSWWKKNQSLALPRPAMAFAGALVFVFLVGGLNHFKHSAQKATNNEYWESLAETPMALSFNDGDGFETTVEQYFL